MTSLQITFRLHVVVDQVQVVIKLLSIENVLLPKARDQTRLSHVFHSRAQVAALKNLAAFKTNLGDAHAGTLGDDEGDGA